MAADLAFHFSEAAIRKAELQFSSGVFINAPQLAECKIAL